MNVTICSRRDIETLTVRGEFPRNTAVISFYDTPDKRVRSEHYAAPDYSRLKCRLYQVAIDDVDPHDLSDYGLTVESFFPEADDIAAFIYEVYRAGEDIICQCDYGDSRSAGCAAAIKEHFTHDGISVFADYRLCPNQMIYNKIHDALDRYRKYESSEYYYCAKPDEIRSRMEHVTGFAEIADSLSFSDKVACIDAKERLERLLREQELLCSSWDDAMRGFTGGRPCRFISLRMTGTEWIASGSESGPVIVRKSHLYAGEPINIQMRMFKIKQERRRHRDIVRREVLFGRCSLREFDLLGVMFWDSDERQIAVTPLILTNMT